jgi:hypothetical protein
MTSASNFRSEIKARKKYKASSSAVPVGRGIESSNARTPLEGSSKHNSSSLLHVSDQAHEGTGDTLYFSITYATQNSRSLRFVLAGSFDIKFVFNLIKHALETGLISCHDCTGRIANDR